MVKEYKDKNEFLDENIEFLNTNKDLSIMMVYDAKILDEFNESNYTFTVNDKNKKLVVLKKSPYGLLLFGDKELTKEALDYILEHDYKIGQLLCEESLGQKFAKEYFHETDKLLMEEICMEYMACNEITIPSYENVERCTIDDLDEIYELMVAFIEDCGVHDEVDKESLKDRVDTYRAIRMDGKIAAIAALTMKVDNTIRIAFVYTRPEYRGMGLAKKLVNSLKNEIIEEGYIATLNVDRKNPVSNHVYTSIGFKGLFNQTSFVEFDPKEYFELYKNNMPFIAKGYHGLCRFLSRSKIIEKRNANGELQGFAIVAKSTIYLIIVRKEDRCKGIGSYLLDECEKYIKWEGLKKANIGVGNGEYLYPGVPTNVKPMEESIPNECLMECLNNDTVEFLQHRGYKHNDDSNIFDMEMNLKNHKYGSESVGDTIDGIKYVFASKDDLDGICKCTDDASREFTKYYKGSYLYEEDSDTKVLIAKDGDKICGCVMVGYDEDSSSGSVGCTSVMRSYRGRRIATNMIILGTKYLQSQGIEKASLEYTYSGLDKMYGKAGYMVNVYYFMAYKKL